MPPCWRLRHKRNGLAVQLVPFLAGPHDVACQHESKAAKVSKATGVTLGPISGLKLPVPTLTLFVMTYFSRKAFLCARAFLGNCRTAVGRQHSQEAASEAAHIRGRNGLVRKRGLHDGRQCAAKLSTAVAGSALGMVDSNEDRAPDCLTMDCSIAARHACPAGKHVKHVLHEESWA